MTIVSELEDLQTNLTNAKDAVVEKGGTVGDTGLAGLADEIGTIRGGSGTFTAKTPYGRLWYAPWEITAELEYAEKCSVTIDLAKFSAYVATNPIQDRSDGQRVNFDYNVEESTWQSSSFETPVDGLTTEQMATQLGITIVLDAGAEWASFELTVEESAVVGADWTYGDLSSSELNELKHSESWERPIKYLIGGKSVHSNFFRRFEFGTTEQKNLMYASGDGYGFMSNTGLVEIGIIPDNIKGWVNDAFIRGSGNFDCPVVIGKGIYAVSLSVAGTTFNRPVVFNPGVPTAEERIEYGLQYLGVCFILGGGNSGLGGDAFNEMLSLGNNVEAVYIQFMQAFNQPLCLPNGLRRLSFQENSSFNQNIQLPPNLTDFAFYDCGSYTSTINVGNLSPEITASTQRPNMFGCSNSSDASYVQGIKIAGANRQAWLNMFPDKSSGGAYPYRHLIDAGY